ncbi:MAG: adenylate/guanylate cyclase domain-containing protein [Acidimicrobiales bacterium]
MTVPETQYTKTADGVNIAFQVLGQGPDLLFHHGWVSNVELMWEVPENARFLRRVASFCRVILFDKRGVGLSDRSVGMPALEEKADDARAVLDAVGVAKAHVLAESEGGPMALHLAAAHPERVRSLMLYGTFARQCWADDYPFGIKPELLLSFADTVEACWGRPEMGQVFAAWDADGEQPPSSVAATIRWCRHSASPREAADALRRNVDLDVRSVLPGVSAPTLILHRRGDQVIPLAHGQYLADHIPGARLVELPGASHAYTAGKTEPVLDALEEWVTGAAPAATVDSERVLATVLFTDIVESTQKAATLGDRRWHDLLDEHDAVVGRILERNRGRRVKSTGDGLLATFDGPARAVRCAHAIVDGTRRIGIDVRAGVHAGEVELRGDDIGGITVHTGARVAALAGPGEVLVSSTVRDLVAGSELKFSDRGVHALRGVPGEWRLLLAVPV